MLATGELPAPILIPKELPSDATQTLDKFQSSQATAGMLRGAFAIVDDWYPLQCYSRMPELPSELVETVVDTSDVSSVVFIFAAMASGRIPDSAAKLLSPSSLDRISTRHPSFEKLINQTIDNAQGEQLRALALETWKINREEAEVNQRLLALLNNSNASAVRFAIQELGSNNRGDDFPDKWRAPVAEAIDRLAETVSLNHDDMLTLHRLGNAAPNAPSYAVTFVKRCLTDESFANDQRDHWRPNLGHVNTFRMAVNILVNSKDELSAEQVYEGWPAAPELSRQDYGALLSLFRAIPPPKSVRPVLNRRK